MTNRESVAAAGLAHWPAQHNITLPCETVGAMLRQHAQNIGDRPAVHFFQDANSDALTTLSYRELLALAENCARWLAAHSAPGDRIAVWSRNALEAVILQYGSALAGTILVHFNTAWTDAEVTHALALVSPAIAFVGVDHAGRELEQRLAGLASCKLLPLHSISEIARTPSQHALPNVEPHHPCLIQFTSGTTGKAKGALLNHRAMLFGGSVRPICEGATEIDVWLNAVPYHHIGGTCSIIIGALGVGGSFVVLESYNRDQLIRLMPKIGATRMGGVPTMWHDILASPDLPATATLSSVSLGGATVPPELARAIFERLGARCGIGYAQSEFPMVSASMPSDHPDVVCESVGKPVPLVELKIIDPASGAILPYGDTGEICVRGPMCMDGYWGNPKATAETIDSDGYLHTGDMGSLAADGYLRIRGRLREVIIRGGENIYPAEIENALLAHPAVAMVAVVGVEHPRLGQDVGAFIKFHAGRDATIEELAAHADKQVASFKVPKTWRFVESMPMTASGKIRKVELEDLLRQS
jgi:fatty-acyl-CoA synthase